MAWSAEVPDSGYVLVWASDVGAYFLLRADDELLPGVRHWRREGGARVYNRGNLEQCAARSGWRYAPIELPPPPEDDEWEDA